MCMCVQRTARVYETGVAVISLVSGGEKLQQIKMKSTHTSILSLLYQITN